MREQCPIFPDLRGVCQPRHDAGDGVCQHHADDADEIAFAARRKAVGVEFRQRQAGGDGMRFDHREAFNRDGVQFFRLNALPQQRVNAGGVIEIFIRRVKRGEQLRRRRLRGVSGQRAPENLPQFDAEPVFEQFRVNIRGDQPFRHVAD